MTLAMLHSAQRKRWIQTYTGRSIVPEDMRPADVNIEDIAHALSLLCRFTGHSKFPYSVGQHSILVSHACAPEDAFWGLLHDASETYLGDVASPLKRTPYLAGYRALEERVQVAICDRFGLAHAMPPSVAKADLVLLATEARDVMGPAPKSWGLTESPLHEAIEPLDPWQVERRFLQRYHELGGL